MNTKNFKCFQVLYEEKNLVPAAKKLFMSPQGLGKLIKTLEDEVGTTLFLRNKEGFVPTEAGKIFYEKSIELEQSFGDLMTKLEIIRNRELRFQIGFAAGAIRAIDINKVQKFMTDNPEIMSIWIENDNAAIKEMVTKGELGFGFVIGEPESNQLQNVLITSVDMCLYVYKGHPFWDLDEINITDIKNEPIISMNNKYRIHQDFLTACHMNGFHPNIIGNVNEGESIITLVANGVGLGVSPRILAEHEQCKPVKLKGDYTWDVYGIYREDHAAIDIIHRLIDSMK